VAAPEVLAVPTVPGEVDPELLELARTVSMAPVEPVVPDLA
jgi:hypothetical protein